MKVRTEYEGSKYITADKLYNVVEFDPQEHSDLCAGAWIVDDEGDTIYILLAESPECNFLDGKSVWEVVEETEE